MRVAWAPWGLRGRVGSDAFQVVKMGFRKGHGKWDLQLRRNHTEMYLFKSRGKLP